MGVSLLIKGRGGTGKSVLGTLILREVINQISESVYYIPYNQFAIESSMVYLNDERKPFIERFVSPEWLMIDEITQVHNGKNFGKIKEFLELILNWRYLEKKPTIITTSLMRDVDLKNAVGEQVLEIFKKKDVWLPTIFIEGSREDPNCVTIDLPSESIVYHAEKIKDAIDVYLKKNHKNIKLWKSLSKKDQFVIENKGKKPKILKPGLVSAEDLENAIRRGIKNG